MRAVLASHQKLHIHDPQLTPAAVLLLLYRKNGEYHVLFTKRTNEVEHHKGQISFPGGAYDESDTCLMDTALRECLEEVGLKGEDVEVLGELDDMATFSAFAISPFVGVIAYAPDFTPNPREIEEIVEIPLSTLLEPANFREETREYDGRSFPVYYYAYGEHVVWGATARILKQFLDLAFAPENRA